jgi:hydroxyacylglutathione hydrolase
MMGLPPFGWIVVPEELPTDRPQLIPIFTDNYVFAFSDGMGGTILVDPGDGPAVADWLDRHNLKASAIWITHHHPDHIGGVDYLRKRYGAKVMGHSRDRARLPPLDTALKEGDRFSLETGEEVEVWSVDGHTRGHLAYWLSSRKWLFSGDVLFSLGCGRLFEGTAQEMWTSLERIMSLPEDSWICCTHEYTEENGRFASIVDGTNEELRKRLSEVSSLRLKDLPTVPVLLGVEKSTNPFLRLRTSAVMDFLGQNEAVSLPERFGRLRSLKDEWDRGR